MLGLYTELGKALCTCSETHLRHMFTGFPKARVCYGSWPVFLGW